MYVHVIFLSLAVSSYQFIIPNSKVKISDEGLTGYARQNDDNSKSSLVEGQHKIQRRSGDTDPDSDDETMLRSESRFGGYYNGLYHGISYQSIVPYYLPVAYGPYPSNYDRQYHRHHHHYPYSSNGWDKFHRGSDDFGYGHVHDEKCQHGHGHGQGYGHDHGDGNTFPYGPGCKHNRPYPPYFGPGQNHGHAHGGHKHNDNCNFDNSSEEIDQMNSSEQPETSTGPVTEATPASTPTPTPTTEDPNPVYDIDVRLGVNRK